MQDDYDGSLKHHEPYWDHQTGTGKIRPILFPEPPWIRMGKQTPSTESFQSPSAPILVARYIVETETWDYFIDSIIQELWGFAHYLDGAPVQRDDFWIYLNYITPPKMPPKEEIKMQEKA